MKKRLCALAVSTAMLLSSVSAFASSGFSDLNEFHSWAEPQIEEMTKTGIIKGYTDGTFRPDRAITKTEALVLISRAAGFITKDYDDFKAIALERYKDIIEEYQSPYPGEVAFLLYKGVLKENDLAGFAAADRADSPLLRYEMASLLTKLMRAESSLNSSSNVKLEYADAGEIPFEAAPFVEYVSNASLMQGVYDPEFPDKVFFKPYDSVTRAQMAVLLHRVLDKLEIKVSYYTILGKNVNNNSLTYRDEAGKTTLFTITDAVNLTLDGYRSKNVEHVASGAKAAFVYINNALADVEIVNAEDNRWNGKEKDDTAITPTAPVEGKISTILLSDNCSITVNDCEYTVSAACSIYVDNVASTIYELRIGHDAKIEFANGQVIMIYASSSASTPVNTVTTEGIITKLDTTERKVHINVTNAHTGEVSRKLLIIETGAAIYNGISGKAIDFLSLEVSDRLIATGTIESDGNFYASKLIVK